MNLFLEKIKNAISNPESISVVNIVSGVLIYTVDNYMLIGAACTFLSTSLIAILNKYNSYKQDSNQFITEILEPMEWNYLLI